MGQCKSKVGALEEAQGGKEREKKSKQRRWRRRKGYSLSASLEGDLDCDIDSSSVRGRSPRDGPVLVSYNVCRGENELSQQGRAVTDWAIREDSSAEPNSFTCMNNYPPAPHPPLAQETLAEPSEPVEPSRDSESYLVQTISSQNTSHSDLLGSEEDPPVSPSTDIGNDNESTLSQDSRTPSGSSQGK